MTDDIYKLLMIVGLVLLASILGILALYSHTIMPGLRKTDDAIFVQSFQAIDRQIINPIFMVQFFAPLFILGVAAFYAHKYQLAETNYLAAAFICYLGAVVVTLAVNVPLNDGIKKVTDMASLDSLSQAREQFNEHKWTIFNHVRTLLTLASTGLSAAAIWVSKLL